MNCFPLNVLLALSLLLMSEIKCQQSTILTTSNLSGGSNQIVVSWTHYGTYTNFYATSKLTGATVTNSWMGIGLNSAGTMVKKKHNFLG